MNRQTTFPQFQSIHPVVLFLLVLHTSFYLLTTVPLFPNRLIFEGMVGVNLLLSDGQWWRFVTPIFIHTSLNHFLFNGFSLYLFGSMLGEWVKKGTLLFLFFSSGIIANLFTYLFASPAFVHAGASGAIFGFLGVFVSLIISGRLTKDYAKVIGTMVLLGVLLSLFQRDVNLYAHIGGFLWGLVYGFLLFRRKK